MDVPFADGPAFLVLHKLTVELDEVRPVLENMPTVICDGLGYRLVREEARPPYELNSMMSTSALNPSVTVLVFVLE